jgi:hypothetical protein
LPGRSPWPALLRDFAMRMAIFTPLAVLLIVLEDTHVRGVIPTPFELGGPGRSVREAPYGPGTTDLGTTHRRLLSVTRRRYCSDWITSANLIPLPDFRRAI